MKSKMTKKQIDAYFADLFQGFYAHANGKSTDKNLPMLAAYYMP